MGELEKQTVNDYQFDMTYDEAGRIETKTGPVVQYDTQGRLVVDGMFKPVTVQGTTSYDYVTSGNGLNQVKKITAPNGIMSEYTYNKLYGSRRNQLQKRPLPFFMTLIWK